MTQGDFMQKRVLILNASHNDERMIRALKELNFYVISTGNTPDLPGHKMCDEYIPADYSDLGKMLDLAQQLKIDRICACCNDFGVKSAAYVAEKMRLPGYDSYETTLILHDKDRFKQFCLKNQILSPVAEQFVDEVSAKRYVQNAIYPLIVKAVDLSAGNGIRKACNIGEAEAAISNAFACSRSKRIIIEPYLEGSQHGFCTFLINKKVVAYCSNNEYSIINPYRVEIDTFPADDEQDAAPVLIGQIEKMANLLNLCDGIFHLQYITDKEKQPHILECMRRIPGGLYTIPAESVSGINWDYWEVRAKCTDSLLDFPVQGHVNRGFFSYKCLMADRNGVIQKISLSDELIHHRYGEWMLSAVGEKITNYRSFPIGYIFGAFSSSEEMKRILIDEYRSTSIEVR
jgi:biotin carboxylase